MSNRKPKIKRIFATASIFCIVITLIVISVPFFTHTANATSSNEVMQKTLANALLSCYNGDIKSNIEDGDIVGNTIDLKRLVLDSGTRSFILPTDIGNNMGTNAATCQDIFLGNGKKLQNIYSFFGKSTPTTLEQIGYAPIEGVEKTEYKCIYLNYYLRVGGVGANYTTNSVCIPVKDGKLTISNAVADTYQADTSNMAVDSSGNPLRGAITLTVADGVLKALVNGSFNNIYGLGSVANLNDGEAFSEVVEELSRTIKYASVSDNMNEEGNIYAKAKDQEAAFSVGQTSGEEGSISTSMGLDSQSANRALKWLAGDSASFDDYVFNDSDWYYIYRTYIDRLVSNNMVSVNSDCKPEYDAMTYTMTYDGTNWCLLENAENVDASMKFGIRENQRRLKLGSLADMLKEMKKLNFSQVDSSLLGGSLGSEIGNIIGEGEPGSEDGGSEATCYNATSLSWIICAAIDVVSGTTNAVYEDIKDNYLEVGTSEMTASKDNGVYLGWEQFRNFANTIFIIMLIIVIFSQVTGLGLTNYGVKKILPTLIMIAVLVNLSFIICQLAVDATNILGDALQAIFNTIGENIKTGDAVTFSDGLKNILGSIGLTVMGAGAATAAITLTGGFSIGSVLIMILATVITCFFSVVFFFIVLAVRKAGVLILVVLSPAAIICYALPNTKKFFDRWMKLFTSLLVVYPVCSLLMGAGKFFSSILMTPDAGVMQSITAVLLQVVPFFLVPSLVKNSLALAGNVGNKISQMGKNWGRRASGNFVRSDAANRLKIGTNQWGRTGGPGKALQKLRKVPVVGGVVRGGSAVARGLGRTAVGRLAKGGVSKLANTKVAQANRARKNALAEDAYNKMIRQDASMIRRAALSDGSTLSNALVTDEQKLMEELANDELSSLTRNGTYQTSDGVMHSVNNNDPEEVAKALAALEADYQNYQSDSPEDALMRDKIMIRINGMKKLLQTRYGSNGASRITESIYSLAYEPDGMTLSQDANKLAAASQLARQFVKDDKLMSELHRNDPGSEQFIIDLANRGLVDGNGQLTAAANKSNTNLAKGRAGYGALSAGKVKAANLADSADTLIANWSKMAADSPEFEQMAATFTQAISDYRTGSNFKKADINKINAELKRGYDATQNNWINGADGQAHIKTLTGYMEDNNGKMVQVQADGMDQNGILTHQGQVLHTEADRSSAALTAKDAYSRQVSAFTPVKVGQPQLKIQQPREMPKRPEGYDDNGNWNQAAMGRSETKRDKLAYDNWVKRTLEIEQQNREIEKANALVAQEQEKYELDVQRQNGNNP